MTMKKIISVIAALVGMMTAAHAQNVSDVAVSGLKMCKDGGEMNIGMDIDLSKLDVKNRRSVHFLPVLKNGQDSLELSPVGVYSRGRYINYLRRGESVFEDLGEKVYKEGDNPAVFRYEATVPYKAWMDGSQIVMNRKTCGCCQDVLQEETTALGGFRIPVFEPYFIYMQPEPEMSKQRELSGSAFIDFVVSRTDINPEYRNNRAELAKITATVDSVKRDEDITVRHLYLKGFASPEGSYSNNERLAKGRTAALKDYVQNMYRMDEGVIRTEYEPENWEGLKSYVAKSDLANKDAILEAIDSDLAPDEKEKKIRTAWPNDYRILLENCYPSLRKTDYRIEYTIVDFTDIDKIVEVFRKSPNKLSLNELYIASKAFEPGSEDYISVFETAVSMYPSDPVANLNAANVAIASGRYNRAEKHLAKAGDSPEAVYAWGLYHMAVGDYYKAQQQFTQAKAQGIDEAEKMLEQCADFKEYHANNR